MPEHGIQPRPSDCALGIAVILGVCGSFAMYFGLGRSVLLSLVLVLVVAWFVSSAVFFPWRCDVTLGKVIAVVVMLCAFGQHAALAVLVLWIGARLERRKRPV